MTASGDRPGDGEVLAVLAAFGLKAAEAGVAPAPRGLIHRTFVCALADGRRCVVQRMHPIFGPDVLLDIDAVTAHLEARGLPTLRPLQTPAGELSVRDADGHCWRVLTYLPGESFDEVTSPAMAREAGRLVARFHRALADLDHRFHFTRANVHDTAAHLGRLERALAEHAAPADPALTALRALGDEILAEARSLPALPAGPRRIAHGDLKISNVLFQGERALALIDLDTVGWQTLAYELGDAFRSWCNPLGEDLEATRFDLEVFRGAVLGYAEEARGLVGANEAASLVPGLLTVCVELAARFCVDAFEDRYFGWDPARFPSRREHNRVRARGQLALARAVRAAQKDAEAIVAGALG